MPNPGVTEQHSNPQVVRLTASELGALLEQAAREQWTELALVGSTVSIPAPTEDWSRTWAWTLTRYDRVHQLAEDCGDLAERVAALKGLGSASLVELGLGDDGARCLQNLTSLTSLDLSANNIGPVGARYLQNLTSLTSLDLFRNNIGPDGARYLQNLTSLTSLDLSANNIGPDGARYLQNLTSLTSLHLFRSNIGPDGARHLQNLTSLAYLDLGSNNVGPDGARYLQNLTSLAYLDLRANNIGPDGARSLQNLTSLAYLDLRANNIGPDGVRCLQNLTSLAYLDLDANNIGDDGAQYLQALTSLAYLDLTGNNIGDDGVRYLAKLTSLESLNLSNTRVTSVAPFRALLAAGLDASLDGFGTGLLLHECPLVEPAPEIVAQGRDAVLNYFRELEAQGTARLFEAKMLIIGKGGAGKTSLLRRLYFPESGLPSVEETTRGIDIHAQSFTPAGGESFRLNVWDFGGQQIYHATNQFFLTKNSLYVLVDDTKEDAKSAHDDGFKSWLELVEVFGDSSPTLIFQNEKGGRSKTIDQAGIKGRFPNVKDVHRGNLAEQGSTDALKRSIEHHVQQLPHIGETLPAQWVEIRTALQELARQQPFISQQQYFDLYAEHLSFDRDKALHLSRFLHDLGVFLHFQGDRRLRDMVVLQNEWATEAVFRVLDDEEVKAQGGRFYVADCDRIWRGCDWQDKQMQLLSLMEKFELCYPVRDSDPEQWLLPQLLPPSLPEGLDEGQQAADLVRQYRYEFLPRGIVNRLMVRMHRFVERPELAWAAGVLFERGASSVLVQVAANGREIHLRARGPEKKELLTVIAGDLEALHQSFQGLEGKVDAWVPCCCSSCVGSTSPHLFAESGLRYRRDKGKHQIECGLSFEDVSVLTLLDGLEAYQLPAWATEREPDVSSNPPANHEPEAPPLRTVTIFLASSSELANDRDAFDLYFRQQNDHLKEEGVYLKIIRWETFLDAMSASRLQDEYNRAVRDSDIFVSLFATKAGKFTREEFQVALESLETTGTKPIIYTYFKNAKVSASGADREALQSLWEFQDKLERRGHYKTDYDDAEHLKRHFRDQLDELRRGGRLGTTSSGVRGE